MGMLQNGNVFFRQSEMLDMDIELKQELAERAFFLEKNITDCLLNIRNNYLQLGRYASELKAGKMYKLLVPEAKNWEHYLSAKGWGLKRASIDNFSQVASMIGNEIGNRDIKLNRALDITRIASKLPEENRKEKILELVDSAEHLTPEGWKSAIREINGQVPPDSCDHSEGMESWSRCKKCDKFFKL